MGMLKKKHGRLRRGCWEIVLGFGGGHDWYFRCCKSCKPSSLVTIGRNCWCQSGEALADGNQRNKKQRKSPSPSSTPPISLVSSIGSQKGNRLAKHKGDWKSMPKYRRMGLQVRDNRPATAQVSRPTPWLEMFHTEKSLEDSKKSTILFSIPKDPNLQLQ